VKIWSGDETVFLAACSQQQLSSDCKQWKIVWDARGLLPTELKCLSQDKPAALVSYEHLGEQLCSLGTRNKDVCIFDVYEKN